MTYRASVNLNALLFYQVRQQHLMDAIHFCQIKSLLACQIDYYNVEMREFERLKSNGNFQEVLNSF